MATERRYRCAVYTRKSTEDGLEQEFNSLDVQREACAAYILSQRHEGWSAVAASYDDGGLSGGSMARPALQQLLFDVAAGRVDIIVVYKVDRLTRSLADFAKIVEILDAKGASFVSVTQAFNTTTSMGRLTLNVLLSFAQFEREVTGERIRDKIAASKAKGMWMGGMLPLGYDVKERKLVIIEQEAERVRRIFALYQEAGSLLALAELLQSQRIVSKLRVFKSGETRGGTFMTRGALQWLLRNPIYIGKIAHKGKVHDGQHEGIVEPETWHAVQKQLDGAAVTRASGTNAAEPSLLVGLLSDAQGRPMSPSHAVRSGKRYRYYITHGDRAGQLAATRVPAHDLEQVVLGQLDAFLSDAGRVLELASEADSATDAGALASMLERAAALRERLSSCPGERHVALRALVSGTRLGKDAIEIDIKACGIAKGSQVKLTLFAAVAKVRRGSETNLVIKAAGSAPSWRDPKLIALIVDAHRVQTALLSGISMSALAEARRTTASAMSRLARLSWLAPDIIARILAGEQPASLNRRTLFEATAIPLAWSEQRPMLGF